MDLKTARFWGGRLLLASAICLAMVLIGLLPASAQVDTGTILGTVSDTSGARITGATVALTNEGTNVSLSTTTGDDGGYKFTPVRIGSY
ncbi:MAG TPA: carboxypeptidase-like regulatory domain-containing protein, partial [Candidatus Eremiobacteraceae bacterium]|nr:carboxypeptidase-like regulatory domain-containing protein [Candidatus Eremiobacteraceae bacterium]